MKKSNIRTAIHQIHLWLGLTTGLIVFLVCITGCIYVFEEDIREVMGEEYLHVPARNHPPINLNHIIDNFEAFSSGSKIGSIKILPTQPAATVEISTPEKTAFYFDPYTGLLICEKKADWLTTILEIHTDLLLGETGRTIQGWAVVIFLVILFSGLIMWFPVQRRLLKQSLVIKWNASAKRINFDLHQVLGFYGSLFLVVIALTGTYFAFNGVKKTVNLLTGSTLSIGEKNRSDQEIFPGPPAQKYQNMYATMNSRYPGAISLAFSKRKNNEIRLRMIYPSKWSRRQNTFFFDGPSGKLLRSKLYINNNAADIYEATNRDLHTGALFGIAGKIIWAMASLIGASLPITGFVIWYKRQKKLKSKALK